MESDEIAASPVPRKYPWMRANCGDGPMTDDPLDAAHTGYRVSLSLDASPPWSPRYIPWICPANALQLPEICPAQSRIGPWKAECHAPGSADVVDRGRNGWNGCTT